MIAKSSIRPTLLAPFHWWAEMLPVALGASHTALKGHCESREVGNLEHVATFTGPGAHFGSRSGIVLHHRHSLRIQDGAVNDCVHEI
jgi:hypothetical protein